MGFKKFQILAKNPKGLPFGFTEKRELAAKIEWNSVFLGRKAQILDWLHIMVLYINFYGFSRISNFGWKSKNFFAFDFVEKW
jgi:hypothetical protein